LFDFVTIALFLKIQRIVIIFRNIQKTIAMLPFKRILLLLFFSSALLAQKPSLPRSTPEAEGVSSAGIISFLDAAAASPHEFHSIMILRHGKVIAEGWWNPYASDIRHTMYSVSKSWTATAVGFAVSEKKLSVEDKVVSFFPNDLPDSVTPFLASLRVKDLLSMSVGQAPDPTGPVVVTDNWAKTFLKTPILYQPGTQFLYNSAATYMLSAIVQKVTGERVFDYLKPRLFDPLGISGIDWETSPQNVNSGGWGLRLKTEDMAKFGELFLQKGIWNGKQILPAAWVEEASTMKIMQEPNAPQIKKDTNDWVQGYCYQMWRCRHNAFRADGAFGQYIIVMPEKDAVVAITSETADMQTELDLVWKYILPAIQDKKLAADSKNQKTLKTRLAALALPAPATRANADMEAKISGKKYGIFSGRRSFESLTLNFTNGVCHLTLDTDSADHPLNFGNGKWEMGQTTKLGPYLVAGAQHNRVGLPAYKVDGAYAWKDDKTLELTLRYVESPHLQTMVLNFDGDYVTIDDVNLMNRNTKRTPVKAVLAGAVANPARLIVRGDDMGFSHSGNEALIKSCTEGIESSIEVIAASPWFPEAVKMLAQHPKVDVGLHFAITSEWETIKWRPLTDCPSIRNADGYYYPMLFKNKNYPGQAVMDQNWKLEDIEKELRAQISLAKKYIPNISHISGHMGVTGFNDDVKAMVQRVAKEYNLVCYDIDAKNYGLSYARADLRNKNEEQKADAFIAMLGTLEPGKSYLFVEHPGMNDDELKAIYHIGYENVAEDRQGVTNLFTSEKVREAVWRKGVLLIGYNELSKK